MITSRNGIELLTNTAATRKICVLLCMFLAGNLSLAEDPTPQEQLYQIADEMRAAIKAGEDKKLVELMSRAAEIQRGISGPTSDEVIEHYGAVAVLAERVGDFKTAVTYHEKVLDARTQAFVDRDHWRVVNARVKLQEVRARAKLDVGQRQKLAAALSDLERGKELARSGKTVEALKVERERLRVIEELIGPNNQDFMEGLLTLNEYLASIGKPDEGGQHLDRAAKIARVVVGERHPFFATVLNLQGVQQAEFGNHVVAIKILSQAKQIKTDALTKNHFEVAVIAVNLGSSYQHTGNTDAAVAEFRAAAKILSQGGKETRVIYAVTLGRLAGALAHLGEHREAMQTYQKALDEQKRCVPRNPEAEGVLLNHFASLYVDLNDFDTALVHYREAETILKGTSPLYHADVLNNLGIMYDKRAGILGSQDDLSSAIGYHKRALEIRSGLAKKGVLRKDHHYIGRSHVNLGSVYLKAKRFNEAEAEFNAALAIFKSSLGPDHIYIGDLRNGLAQAYFFSKRYSDALKDFEEAARIARASLSDKHQSCLSVESNIAMALMGLGRREEALARIRNVVVKSWDSRDENFDTLSKRQRLVLLSGKTSYLDLYLTWALETQEPASELYSLVASDKGYFTTRGEAERLAREHPSAETNVKRYLELCSAIKILVEKNTALSEADRTKLREYENQKERVEVQLSEFDGYFRHVQIDVARAVGDRLSSNVAVIDFVTYRHIIDALPSPDRAKFELRMLAFVLRRGHKPVIVPLGRSEPIAAAVAQWRKAVREGITPVSGHALAALVWEPLRPHLNEIKTILVCPDGPVCGIPFSALPCGPDKPGSVLLEDYAFGYVTSVRQWLDRSSQPRIPPSDGALVVGRLNYGVPPAAAKNRRFPPIGSPGTSDGLESLLDEFGRFSKRENVKFMKEGGATVANFRAEFDSKRQGPRYKHVHLETHGFWVPLDKSTWSKMSVGEAKAATPNLSSVIRSSEFRTGLAFDRANESPEGILTGEEVSVLDLRGVDLMTLAVCQSGEGDTVPNEGSRALQQSFQAAGVRTIVSGLWEIPIPETRKLVAEFYRNLATLGEGHKLEALRNAQLALRRRTGSEPLPPLYWAGWVMSGDPGEISELKDPIELGATPDTAPLLTEDVGNSSDREISWVLVAVAVAAGGVGLLLVLVVARGRRREVATVQPGTRPGPEPRTGNSDPAAL